MGELNGVCRSRSESDPAVENDPSQNHCHSPGQPMKQIRWRGIEAMPEVQGEGEEQKRAEEGERTGVGEEHQGEGGDGGNAGGQG